MSSLVKVRKKRAARKRKGARVDEAENSNTSCTNDWPVSLSSLDNELTSHFPKGPTQVQKRFIDSAHSSPDSSILCASKTGTGKTLAFSIPALEDILKSKKESNDRKPKEPKLVSDEEVLDLNEIYANALTEEEPLKIHSLILAPSRELAMQIKSQLDNICKNLDVNIMSLTGGVNHFKQKSIIEKSPDIVVGTPGRVFDYANIDQAFMSSLHNIKYLIFDEADKLFDDASFSEISDLINIIKSRSDSNIRVFIVSATLYSIEGKTSSSSKKYIKKILNKLGIMDNISILNLIDSKALPEQLEEFKVCCLHDNKDLYLLYLLEMYDEKIIIFVNSKDRMKTLASKLLC